MDYHEHLVGERVTLSLCTIHINRKQAIHP